MNTDYTIELQSGSKINLLFNTWTFRNYSYRKGIELEELFERVGNGSAFKANDLPILLSTAAESYARFAKLDVKYSEDDACLWMDEIGMIISAPKVMEIYRVFVAKLVNVDPKQLEVMVQESQQTKEEKPVTKKKKGKV